MEFWKRAKFPFTLKWFIIMFPPPLRFKLLQTTLSHLPLLSRWGAPGFKICAVCRIIIFFATAVSKFSLGCSGSFSRIWITRVFRPVVVQICFAEHVVVYSFTLLEFRFNIRWFLLLSSLRLCKYFINRLQMLTWAETMVKILYFTIAVSQFKALSLRWLFTCPLLCPSGGTDN